MPLPPLAAAVTLGQAPREDILDEMRAEMPEFRWVQLGALDEIDEDVLERLRPATNEFPLATRLRGGRAVLVGEQAVRPFVQRAVDRAAPGADLIVVLSSSPLDLESPVPVLFPDRLLTAAVSSFGRNARIVVLTPSPEQIPLQQARWRSLGFVPEVLYASPYGGTDFRLVGDDIRRTGASAVVLDCIAYSSCMRDAVARASGLPTLLVRSLVATLAHQAVCVTDDGPEASGSGVLAFAGPREAGRRALAGGAARLASEIRLAYFLGDVRPGDRLPSVRELARRLGVSPTTVAEWYRSLGYRGLVSTRQRSGIFVNSPGDPLAPGTPDASMLRVLQRAVRQLDLIGRSVREAADLLRPCVDAAGKRFTFGCVMHREMYDLLVPHLERRLGFRLPLTLFPCHERSYAAIRQDIAASRSVRCLLTTFLDLPHAGRLAADLGLDLVHLQLHRATVALLRPPEHGRRRVITRDPSFAAAMRSLVTLLRDAEPEAQEDPRVLFSSVAEKEVLEPPGPGADEVAVSPAALEILRARRGASVGRLRLFQLRLADSTVDEILLRFLLFARQKDGSPLIRT